jgi:hypothetical protein
VQSQAAGCRYVELLAASSLAELTGDSTALEEVCRAWDDARFEPPILRRAREILRTRKVM